MVATRSVRRAAPRRAALALRVGRIPSPTYRAVASVYPSFRVMMTGVSMLALVTGGAIARPLGGSAVDAGASAAMQALATAQSGSQQGANAARDAQQSLLRATQAIQAMQAAQNAARAMAQSATVAVPNGLTRGGLQVAPGAIAGSALWRGANLPTQSVENGRTDVRIDQTQAQAILNWQTFNLGRETTLTFNQQGNANWVALNRVAADTGPSQILGSIKSDGQVLVINPNGIVFSGTSQINVGSLIASSANITDSKFLSTGIYSAESSGIYAPSFTGATAPIVVQAGAQIATSAPKSVTAGGGFVALIGSSVSNAGAIVTPKGQALLAAGTDFIVRRGYGPDANVASTTRGSEISPSIFTIDENQNGTLVSGGGAVSNSGIILSQQGDITLAGREITQTGVLVSTTSVNTRGTIHLLNSASDTLGSVTLAGNSVTAILPELDSDETALNSQRDGLIASRGTAGSGSYGIQFDNLSRSSDRLDLSRVEIVTGGAVTFQGGSLTLAQGGQIDVAAGKRVFAGSGAIVDVSGTTGTLLPMAANAFKVNIQGNEQRDAPGARDSGGLLNSDVWIDARDLVLVPAGTGGYATDRYYTPGGLLEVSGYLNNTAHKIGEWTALGGTISLASNEVVTQSGAIFNISGGAVQYQGGNINQSFLRGSDGRMYRVDSAPSYLTYDGVYKGFLVDHARWGVKEYYSGVIGDKSKSTRYEQGYSVGRDAGRLILSTPTSIFEGQIIADVITGERQSNKRPAGVTDSYKLSQTTAPLQGTLGLGNFVNGSVFAVDVRFTNALPSIANALASNGALGNDRVGTAWFDSGHLNSFALGGLTVTTGEKISVEAPLTLASGGSVAFAAPTVDLQAGITVRGGNVSVSNTVGQTSDPSLVVGGIILRAGAAIDTRGLWTNARLDRANLAGLAYVDGGNVKFDSVGAVTLERGSLIDASSGGAILGSGQTKGGKGGDITLTADQYSQYDRSGDQLVLNGTIRSYGVTKGGVLTLQTGQAIVLSNQPLLADGMLAARRAAPTALQLAADYVIPAGATVPFSYSINISRLAAGEAAPVGFTPVFTTPYVLPADWTVPDGLYPRDTNFNYYYPGAVVPAGTAINLASGSAPAGYVIPADVFPNGLAINTVTQTFAAGSVAQQALTVPSGTVVPVGTSLPQNASVVSPLNLNPDFFGQGFSAYNLTGTLGVQVTSGTSVNVTMPVYRTTASSFNAATGSDPSSALEVWTPPLYTENARTAQLTQRAGASLSLASTSTVSPLGKSNFDSAGVLIDTGAVLRVDPGQSVNLATVTQLTVNGAVVAHGGAIKLASSENVSVIGPLGRTIWIGETGVLDVSAQAATALDFRGRAYGVVRDGGSITIGSKKTDVQIVIRPGARLDASGTSAVIDQSAGLSPAAATGPLTLASNGGSISLGSIFSIFTDGDLRAAAGGRGASGGALTILLDIRDPMGSIPPDYELVPRLFTITQNYVASALPATLKPGEVDPSLTFGEARFSASQVSAGGFDSLTFGNGGFVFDGPVALNVGRSISLLGSSQTSTDAVSAVSINAPYVVMGGVGSATSGIPTTSSAASFTVNAGLIDIQDSLSFGDVARAGFRDVNLVSSGDIRFVRNPATGATVDLKTNGNLALTAAQIYPTTGTLANVTAGLDPTLTDGKIVIRRFSDATPQAPFSAFGSLSLTAPIIDQGGIVRAPLGQLTLGSYDPNTGQSDGTVILRPGSITSVSAAGVILPYGGTTDGVTYKYNGGDVALDSLSASFGGQSGGRLTLKGRSIVGEAGATLDLSGGGVLAGAGFISGRGGSVDVLTTPLVNANPANSYSAAGNGVYAIVPGYSSGYAPVDPGGGAAPGVGQQVTIPAGVPGLPAGTYTLLPGRYALLPGAYRVEVGGATRTPIRGAGALGNGSYLVSGGTGIANTSIASQLPVNMIVTPGKTVRSYSQYNETSYNDFAVVRAATLALPPPTLTSDAKTLNLILSPGEKEAFVFDGTALFAPAEGGKGGTASVDVPQDNQNPTLVEIFGAAPTEGYAGVSISADSLNALGVSRLVIGGVLKTDVGSGLTLRLAGETKIIDVRADAYLRAAEIFLVTKAGLDTYGINIEAGARLETIGRGPAPFDSSNGYLYDGISSSVVAISNGDLNFVPPRTFGGPDEVQGTIRIGFCPGGVCAGDARLLSEGTVAFSNLGAVQFGPNFQLGGRYLGLSFSTINAGDPGALANANVPGGFLLTQALLDRLVSGDPILGVPRVERLTLGASQSVNFFGSVALSTLDPATGQSFVKQLVLNTPAIYGYGDAADVASLSTGTLIWNGIITPGDINNPYVSGAAGPVIANGPGTGGGTLNINAQRIEFGFSDRDLKRNEVTLDRIALGFANVNLTATDRITANSKGTLSVYQAQGDYVAGSGYAYSGGNLNLITPLLTGEPGSVNSITAGGALTLFAPQGATAAAIDGRSLGAEIHLSAASITQRDTVIALPSGRLTMDAAGDILLGAQSRIDLAGRDVLLIDQTRYSWGGDAVITSAQGNVTQQAGSVIDMSAINNDAGTLTVYAVGDAAGRVDLAGTIKGGSTGQYAAGGTTLVPYAMGGIDVRGQTVADFTALNLRLTDGGVTGSRSFAIKQGDLVIGDEVKARVVTISVDGGSLTVNGRIDASGAEVGTIRLSARDNLTLASGSVLDAHASVLRVDGYGKPIDSPNRAIVELTTTQGTLTLAPGATIDLRAADTVARGTIELNAPRTGGAGGTGDGANDIAISAGGPLDIRGVRSIAVNGFRSYDDAPLDPNPNASGRPTQIITQGYLDGIDTSSAAFIDAAGLNGALQRRLAGLKAYGDAFHLRPGVEIRSSTPNGDLSVQGDLDLAGYRYGPNAGRDATLPNYGAGEAGSLVIRAGGDLNIYGSITDGFGKPVAVTDADNGYVAIRGEQYGSGTDPNSADLKLPRAIVLAPGAQFDPRGSLNFAIPLGEMGVRANVVIPADVTLAASFFAPTSGFVARATITLPDGQTFARGQTVPGGTELPAGTTLAAGTLLPGTITIQPMTWQANASLQIFSNAIVTTDDLLLPAGSIIPALTNLSSGFVTTNENGERVVTNVLPLRDPGASGNQGALYAVAPMLPAGSQSWSMRLVAGADLKSADTRAVKPAGGEGGSINLADTHYFGSAKQILPGNAQGIDPSDDASYWCGVYPEICGPGPDAKFLLRNRAPLPSVLRTGTGDLDLIASRDYKQFSLFGVYTAGTQASVDPQFLLPRSQDLTASFEGLSSQAYYPEHGGNVLLSAGGNIFGFSLGSLSTNLIGNWMGRQGGDIAQQSAAWWINFGSFADFTDGFGAPTRTVIGFTGLGTLGGGNVTVLGGGDISTPSQNPSNPNQALDVAVAGSGRVTSVANDGGVVTGGTLDLTGGGDLSIKLAGSIYANNNTVATGTLTNLRGNIDLRAGSVGALYLQYNAVGGAGQTDPLAPTDAQRIYGPITAIGDGAVQITTLRDLVTGGSDPGLGYLRTRTAFTRADGTFYATGGQTYFTLQRPTTTIDLFSAGGNLAPGGAAVFSGAGDYILSNGAGDGPQTARVVAANGSIFGGTGIGPSPSGQLELLARGSIYNAGASASGASDDPNSIANPFRPFFYYYNYDFNTGEETTFTNGNPSAFSNGIVTPASLYPFVPNTVVGKVHAADPEPIRIYAAEGDIKGLNTGAIIRNAATGFLAYVGAKPIRAIAGRDIIGGGGLIVHNNESDVSVISAGRDIYNFSMSIAGPGLLDITAGGNIYQADSGVLQSIGPIVNIDPTSRSGGAGISLIAGVGPNGLNYSGFASRYLDAANRANPELTLAEQPGKVVKTYETELLAWLQARFGYAGTPTEALAYFAALPNEQQGVFVRQVYFAELTLGGREYNDALGPRFGSYLRGREAIATLFPSADAAGQPVTYDGDITMFSTLTGNVTKDSGIRTDFGGNIQTLTPGGRVLVGVEGVAPGANAGIVTQGSGDIQMYAQGSVLLGQSRILTTFGGNIVVWSAEGDINAGRGSKTTTLFTPPRRVYDNYGNVSLSPQVPSSGAGIATLNPIPEVPAGDIDLIAPLGTVDAGEAGVRVSGNINIAALQVVNAANIQVQGTSTGIPVAAPSNVSALTAASNTAGAATRVTDPGQPAAQTQPSVIIVEVVGFGGSETVAPRARDCEESNDSNCPAKDRRSQDPNSAVQVVGAGVLSEKQRQALTEEERQSMTRRGR